MTKAQIKKLIKSGADLSQDVPAGDHHLIPQIEAEIAAESKGKKAPSKKARPKKKTGIGGKRGAGQSQ